jgi:succinate-semialdehyde dehydrogenase/glutarate-semialdehyde dehydrogenase
MMDSIVGDQIRNAEPATGRALPPIKVTSPREVHEAVARARAAQEGWAALGFDGRKRKLLAFRDLVYDRTDELITLIMRQNGKPRFEALHEVISVIDFAHYFATRSKKILRDRKIWLHLFWPLKRSRIQYVPRGVVGIISTWNFPLWIPIGDVLVALAAGNSVVLKPSEWAAHTSLRAHELFVEAGIDPDVVQVLPGGAETGTALVDAEPDMMTFTGSSSTGRRVAAACGERLIPFIAELGGKDPVIILPDADLENVARHAVTGAFYNCGQTCASMERVLVHESMYEPFVNRVVELTEELRVEDSVAASPAHTDVGPLTVPRQLEVVKEHIDDAVARGATILAGGRAAPAADAGQFFEPTVLVDVTDEMLCWKEETFGPLLPIRKYSSVDEAVAMANDNAYGLNAYVYSSSIPRAEEIAERLEVGSVVINDFLVNAGTPETPWGGIKNSGIGRIHGRQGLREMCDVRHVFSPRGSLTLPMRYPYNERHYVAMHRWLRGLFRGIVARFL